jgi:DNA gyrase subunit A
MTTLRGVVKRVKVTDFKNIRTNGIIAINLDEGDTLRWVEITDGNKDVMLLSRDGMVIRFKEDEVRPIGRAARGVRGMQLKGKDRIVDNSVGSVDEENASLLIIAESGIGKRINIKEFRLQKRAGLGLRSIKLKVGDFLAGGAIVTNEDEVIIVSEKGTVSRQSCKPISKQGRAARGVRVQKLDVKDKVVAFARLLDEEKES